MDAQVLRSMVLVLTFAVTLALYPQVEAAKPDKTGGGGSGGSDTEAAAVAGPEFYRVELDPFTRVLRLHGVNFIGGDEVTPVFPSELRVAGQGVIIDQAASLATMDFTTGKGALVVPFDNLLDALVGSAPPGRVLTALRNFEIKVTTSDGGASFSAYISRDIKDVPADTGICPCSFVPYYDNNDAQPGSLFCSSTQGVDTDEYIEAGYGLIDENNNASAVIMGSHSSASPESLYESTCYVRDLSQIVDGVETPVYLEGPIAIGNGDHALCVAAIQAAEPACTISP